MPSQTGTEPSQTALCIARIWPFLAFLNYFLYSVDRGVASPVPSGLFGQLLRAGGRVEPVSIRSKLTSNLALSLFFTTSAFLFSPFIDYLYTKLFNSQLGILIIL
jgi:hypothetical protein